MPDREMSPDNPGAGRLPSRSHLWQLGLAVVAGTLLWLVLANPLRSREGWLRALQNQVSGNCRAFGVERAGDSAVVSPAAPLGWVRLAQAPPVTFGYPMVSDASRGKVWLFARPDFWSRPTLDDVWWWDGVSWGHRTLPRGPTPRTDFALFSDPARGTVLLFGGHGDTGLRGDTWQWDGDTWNRRVCKRLPGRVRPAITYDTARRRAVLFGGAAGTLEEYCLQDTWEWDGEDWVQAKPRAFPGARLNHAMAFDQDRGRTVLFGGASDDNGYTVFSDTWEWDGTDWEKKDPATSPPARHRHVMAFDPARRVVLMLGGAAGPHEGSPGKTFDDVWQYDGQNWTSLEVAPRPGLGTGHGGLVLEPVSGKLVMFAGRTGPDSGVIDRWEWTGSSWAPTPVLPGPRENATALFDDGRGRLTVFGGRFSRAMDDLWEWDGRSWAERSPGLRPPARFASAATQVPGRSLGLFFGGQTVEELLGDTWLWDGKAWRQAAGQDGPRPRSYSAMAWDRTRKRAVLFGGLTREGNEPRCLDDTWEFDGTRWTRLEPAHRPPARRGHGLVHAEASRHVLLFGGWAPGWGDGTYFCDLWAWDGRDWTRLPASNRPTGREQPLLFADDPRSRLLMFGGVNCCALWEGPSGSRGAPAGTDDAWQLKDGVWSPLAVRCALPAFKNGAAAFDPRSRRAFFFGGVTRAGPSGDVWTLELGR